MRKISLILVYVLEFKYTVYNMESPGTKQLTGCWGIRVQRFQCIYITGKLCNYSSYLLTLSCFQHRVVCREHLLSRLLFCFSLTFWPHFMRITEHKSLVFYLVCFTRSQLINWADSVLKLKMLNIVTQNIFVSIHGYEKLVEYLTQQTSVRSKDSCPYIFFCIIKYI